MVVLTGRRAADGADSGARWRVTVARVNDKRTGADQRADSVLWASCRRGRARPRRCELLPLPYCTGVLGDFVPALGQEKEALA